MKKLAVITLFAYVALALFAFVGMHEHSSFNACLRTAFPFSMPCTGSAPNDAAAGQVGVYHAFSASTASTLAWLLALAFLASLALESVGQIQLPAVAVYFSDSRQNTASYKKLSHWFTRLQKRDPLAV
jgi:hypothetical protein